MAICFYLTALKWQIKNSFYSKLLLYDLKIGSTAQFKIQLNTQILITYSFPTKIRGREENKRLSNFRVLSQTSS